MSILTTTVLASSMWAASVVLTMVMTFDPERGAQYQSVFMLSLAVAMSASMLLAHRYTQEALMIRMHDELTAEDGEVRHLHVAP